MPDNMKVSLALRSRYEDGSLLPEFPDETEVSYKGRMEAYQIYEIEFHRLGENQIKIWYDNHKKWMTLEYFVTEPLDMLLEKRAAFLTGKQCRDESKWYRGLLCEWDNEEKTCVTPEKHDRLNGWFIYAICSDDPGLAKPSFLSSKIAEQPVQEQVDALDEYIEYFVWGDFNCGMMRNIPMAFMEYPTGMSIVTMQIPEWIWTCSSPLPAIYGEYMIIRI